MVNRVSSKYSASTGSITRQHLRKYGKSMQELRRIGVGFSILLFGLCAGSASGDIQVDVNFIDPSNLFSDLYSTIDSHAKAAGARWGSNFSGNTSLQLEVVFSDSIPRATGGSVTSAFVANRGGFNIFEQGVGAEIRTGTDPNGASPDLRFTFNSNYLRNELWFDSNPFTRVAIVPSNRTDAVSVFLHEFGHAIAFNGWQDSFNGTYPGDYKSNFDERKTFNGNDFFFNGSSATSLYGGPVPVTFGNATHLGNDAPRPGSDLIPDLMNGVVFNRGTRYDISPLDLAILSDTGFTITSVPEPNSIASCLIVAILFGIYGMRHGMLSKRDTFKNVFTENRLKPDLPHVDVQHDADPQFLSQVRIVPGSRRDQPRISKSWPQDAASTWRRVRWSST